MAVIVLPDDRRAQLIGQGIGELVGTFVGQRLRDDQWRRMAQGVTEIQKDPNIEPGNQNVEILNRYGLQGLALTKALAAQQLAGINIKEKQAQTELAQQRAALAGGQLQLLPLTAAQREAQLKNVQSETAAREAKLPGELAEQGATLALRGAETTRAQAGASSEALTAQQKQQDLDRDRMLAQMFANARTPEGAQQLESIQEQLGYSPEQMNALRMQYAVGGAKGVAKQVEATTTAKTRAEIQAAKPLTLPEVEISRAGGVVQKAATMGQVMDTIEQAPGAIGGPVAAIKSYLQRTTSLFQDDPEFAKRVTANEQLVADSVASGAGFVGKARIDLAHGTLPSIVQGKMRQVMELNTILHGEIANQETRRMAFRDQYTTAPIDHSIEQLKKQFDRTDSLWWTRGGKQVFFKGQQVNPNTLKPIEGGAKEFPENYRVTIGGQPYTGALINTNARQLGMTPEGLLAAMKEQAGGQ